MVVRSTDDQALVVEQLLTPAVVGLVTAQRAVL
jgi:hypothetical protein